MNTNPVLPKDKRLTIIFRVEPGCLGPEGKNSIDKFCELAQKAIEPVASDFIQWLVVPRNDKSQSETQYKVGAKILTREKAKTYLKMLELNIDEVEGQLLEKITYLIEQFLDR